MSFSPLLSSQFISWAPSPFNQCGSLLNTATSIRFHLDLIYNADGMALAAPRATARLLKAFSGRRSFSHPVGSDYCIRWSALAISRKICSVFLLMGLVVAITIPMSTVCLRYLAAEDSTNSYRSTFSYLQFVNFVNSPYALVSFWGKKVAGNHDVPLQGMCESSAHWVLRYSWQSRGERKVRCLGPQFVSPATLQHTWLQELKLQVTR